MEDPAIMPPAPSNGRTWLWWIVSTVVLPSVAGSICSLNELTGFAALIIVLTAIGMHRNLSRELPGIHGCAALFFYFSGWALIMFSFFVGCIAIWGPISVR